MMGLGVRSAAAVVLAAAVLGASVAHAQEQQLSELAVKKYMDYAWSMTPSKFTRPDGKVIEIDKKLRDKILIPIPEAREVIMAARRTAWAQACELAQDQVDNYRSLMKREEGSGKWSDQQIIYINQLHLTTVMLLAGTVKLVELQDGNKEVVIEEKAARLKSCTEEEAKRVRDQIATYVKSGPPLVRAAADPAATPAASTAPATTASTPASGPAGATPVKKP